MTSKTTWTRRAFLSTAGLVSASKVIPRPLNALSLSTRKADLSYLACIASHLSSTDTSPRELRAYAVRGGSWRIIARMPCTDAIGAVAIHPWHNVVYVAHDTKEYLGIPGASVSSFALDPSSNGFVQLNRQALTLSATHPGHLAISPDGKALLVAATGGGAYNALQLAPDGRILPEKRAIKLTGCGPHRLQASAKPVYLRFDRSGRVAYGCDFGSDRIDQIRYTDGVPHIESYLSLASGSGPWRLAIHPSQPRIAVVGRLNSTVTVIAVDPRSARLEKIVQQLAVNAAALTHASFCASKNELSVAGVISAGEYAVFTFRMDSASRAIRQTEMKRFAATGFSEISNKEGRIEFPWSIHNIAARPLYPLAR